MGLGAVREGLLEHDALYFSPISPLYLPHISPISPLLLEHGVRRLVLLEPQQDLRVQERRGGEGGVRLDARGAAAQRAVVVGREVVRLLRVRARARLRVRVRARVRVRGAR